MKIVKRFSFVFAPVAQVFRAMGKNIEQTERKREVVWDDENRNLRCGN